MKAEKFGIKIITRGDRHIQESELKAMKKYQLGLIDYLCYECDIRKSNLIHSQIFGEIKNIEIWLKKNYRDFVHNNRQKVSECEY